MLNNHFPPISYGYTKQSTTNSGSSCSTERFSAIRRISKILKNFVKVLSATLQLLPRTEIFVGLCQLFFSHKSVSWSVNAHREYFSNVKRSSEDFTIVEQMEENVLSNHVSTWTSNFRPFLSTIKFKCTKKVLLHHPNVPTCIFQPLTCAK